MSYQLSNSFWARFSKLLVLSCLGCILGYFFHIIFHEVLSCRNFISILVGFISSLLFVYIMIRKWDDLKVPLYLWGVFSLLSYIFIGLSSTYLSPWGGGLAVDNSIYHIIGRQWFKGAIPYVDITDLKGPFIFLYYGIASIFTPTTLSGLGVIHSIWVGLGMFFAYKTARLYLTRWFSFSLVCLYYYWTLFFLGNPSEVIWVLQHITIYYLLKLSIKKELQANKKTLIFIGVFSGITLLTKFNLLAFFAPICILSVLRGVNGYLRSTCYILFGLLTVITPILVFFYYNEALTDFLNECFITSYLYGKCPFHESAIYTHHITLFSFIAGGDIASYIPVPKYVLTSFGLLFSFFGFTLLRNDEQEERIVSLTLLSSFILSFFAIYIGRHSFNHYSFTLYPYAYISLIAAAKQISKFNSPKINYLTKAAGFLIFITLTATKGLHTYKKYVSEKGDGYVLKTAIKQLVTTTEKEKILVIGGHSSCLAYYVIADKIPPIKHFTPPLTSTGQHIYESEILKSLKHDNISYILIPTYASEEVNQFLYTNSIDYRIALQNDNPIMPFLLYKTAKQINNSPL